MIERHLKASLESRDQIIKLASGVPTASKQFGSSVYPITRESLAQAAELKLRRIVATRGGTVYGEDEPCMIWLKPISEARH